MVVIVRRAEISRLGLVKGQDLWNGGLGLGFCRIGVGQRLASGVQHLLATGYLLGE